MKGRPRANLKYAADPRVDAYIDALPLWQQDICREVRDLVHAVDADVSETIKRSRLPYFVLEGNVCALLAAKDHINIFLYDGAVVPARQQDGAHRRHPPRREAQRTSPQGDVQSDRCQQPRGRLAQAQARAAVASSGHEGAPFVSWPIACCDTTLTGSTHPRPSGPRTS